MLSNNAQIQYQAKQYEILYDVCKAHHRQTVVPMTGIDFYIFIPKYVPYKVNLLEYI